MAPRFGATIVIDNGHAMRSPVDSDHVFTVHFGSRTPNDGKVLDIGVWSRARAYGGGGTPGANRFSIPTRALSVTS